MVPNGDESEKTSIVTSDTFKGRMKAADDSPPALVVLMGPTGYVGKQFPLIQSEIIVGRSVEAQIFIDDKSISRSHARVNVSGSEVAILDLDSSNKTVVNGEILAPLSPHKLKNNDQIKTGNVIFKFLERGNIEAVANKELNEKAHKDALTGAYSKGALIEKGPEAMKRAEFLNEDLSLLVFDIDFFKKINDTHGHTAGDMVLRELAQVISKKMVRQNDYFARYGGEEFVILLQGSSQPTSVDVAERIRVTIEAHPFVYSGTQIPVTVSLGVATRHPSESDWQQVLKRADDALYTSKRNGRNKVTAAK
jgi:two-component system, cell cycle response regulator